MAETLLALLVEDAPWSPRMDGWRAVVYSAALGSVLVSLLLQPQARAPHTSAQGADGQSTSRHWGGDSMYGKSKAGL